jgi:hypothetical protein
LTREEYLNSADPYALLSYLTARPRIARHVSDRKLLLAAIAFRRANLPPKMADHVIDKIHHAEEAIETGDRSHAVFSYDAAGVALMSLHSVRQGCGDDSLPRCADVVREIAGDPFLPVELGHECPRCQGEGLWYEQIFGAYQNNDKRERRCEMCLGDGRIGRRELRTPDVLALVNAAYHDRNADGTLRADGLAILSDALEEAGCNDERILDHLRSPVTHWRGCWALDLALTKQ